MALLRGLAIELIRKTSPKNFQAAIENFTDSVSTLESMLNPYLAHFHDFRLLHDNNLLI